MTIHTARVIIGIVITTVLFASAWECWHGQFNRRHAWVILTFGAYWAIDHAMTGHITRTIIGLGITAAGTHAVRTTPAQRDS